MESLSGISTTAFGTLTRLTGDSAATTLRPSIERRQDDFLSTIARKGTRGADPKALAREAAEDFVSIGLVQPLLAHLRENNHAAPPFQPTQAEKQFRGMMDASFARQFVRSTRMPLVDAVARNLLEYSARRAQAKEALS